LATSTADSSSSTTLTPRSSGTLVLAFGSSIRIGTVNAALRLIASLAPASGLLGESDTDQAKVDGWLSFLWSSVDLPLQVLVQDPQSQAALKDLFDVLVNIDALMLRQTFLVGHSPTLADIRLAVSLEQATALGFWDAGTESTANLGRFYQTVAHQPWFATPASRAPSLPTRDSTTPNGTQGVLLNGAAPPVVNKMYRRHRIRIKEILKADATACVDQTITVAGWARTVRKQGAKLMFVELNDGSVGTSLQCVLHEPTCEGFDGCKTNGGTGASFQFVGKVVQSQGEGQLVELQVSSAKLLGAVYAGNIEGTEIGGMLYPMPKKDLTLEHMREQAHLRPRGAIHAAAMRIRHCMAYATHNFFHNHGFLYIHTPIVTGADCEGAGEQFGITTLLGSDHHQKDIALPVHQPPEEVEKKLSKSEMKRLAKNQAKAKVDPNKPIEETVIGAVDYSTDFFGQRVNLTVSGQLNVETHACALSDVYTFGPTFRAENSFTSRHLSEFWMIEPEIAFADLTDDINLAEDYLKYCVEYALENCADDLEFFENNPYGEMGLRDRLRNVIANPFKRLTYTEAIEILQNAVAEGHKFEETPVWGMDLPSEHERFICEKVFQQPVVLTDYPKDIKAFYMKLNDDGKTVAAADVLVPKIGEIIGGSQREHRMDVLKQRCLEMNLDPRSVWWYLDLRRYGTVPHAGFGLGFERLILFITGLSNIRDVIPFPRWAGNSKF
jgi:asparaginyl-tRNA synthetase